MKHRIVVRIRTLAAVLASLTAICGYAQNAPAIQPYGKVDKADLELKQCDFEPDANAEVLFDYTVEDRKGALPVSRHTRIKIFNDFGKNYGSMELAYYIWHTGGKFNEAVDGITDLKAQTINEEDGKVIVTPLDKKDIMKVKLDKWRSALKFAMPALKPGSIIDLSYSELIPSTWNFQNYIPVRYSEVEIDMPGTADFKSIPRVKQPFVKSTGEPTDNHQVRAMANIHSMPREPYMGSRVGNLQHIEFIGVETRLNTWNKIARALAEVDAFGQDLNSRLDDEAEIMDKVKLMKTQDEKIDYIFDQVKTRVTWNGFFSPVSEDGFRAVWKKKIGSSADINMIVYHLLHRSGIKAIPVMACTKNQGKINPANPSLDFFNTVVVYASVDSTKNYILDATSKYALPTTAPESILNSFGLGIDIDNALSVSISNNVKSAKTIFIADDEPAVQSVSFNAEIKPDGKVDGSAEISSSSYSKIRALKAFDSTTQEKYLDILKNNNNDLKISSFTREGIEQDSLPLTEKFNFSLAPSGADGDYIYLKTDFLNTAGKNPFLSETRFSDIDFGYFDNHSFVATFKLPAGYKVDAIPKSIALMMPDQSIIFKRTVAKDDESILIKYIIVHKKTIYFKEDYDELRTFYQKMYEMMGEQVVLKKG